MGGVSGVRYNFCLQATNSTIINAETDASRFLARATFGGSKSEIAALTGHRRCRLDDSSEFAKPATLTLPAILAHARAPRNAGNGGQVIDGMYWDQILTANDQLRQRVWPSRCRKSSSILTKPNDNQRVQGLLSGYPDQQRLRKLSRYPASRSPIRPPWPSI